MKVAAQYYGLSSLGDDFCDLSNEDYERARNSWLCTGCSSPKPDIDRIDIVATHLPSLPPVNFVNGCGLGIIRIDFLSKFPEQYVAKDLMLGEVRMPNGSEASEWVTYRGRKRIIVRGTDKAGH